MILDVKYISFNLSFNSHHFLSLVYPLPLQIGIGFNLPRFLLFFKLSSPFIILFLLNLAKTRYCLLDLSNKHHAIVQELNQPTYQIEQYHIVVHHLHN